MRLLLWRGGYEQITKGFIVNYKDKLTLSTHGRRGFLTSPMQSVQVLSKSTITPNPIDNVSSNIRDWFIKGIQLNKSSSNVTQTPSLLQRSNMFIVFIRTSVSAPAERYVRLSHIALRMRIIVKSKNMFTPLVGAVSNRTIYTGTVSKLSLPSCISNYGFYYNVSGLTHSPACGR